MLNKILPVLYNPQSIRFIGDQSSQGKILNFRRINKIINIVSQNAYFKSCSRIKINTKYIINIAGIASQNSSKKFIF